jgi:hypothetical protein
MITALLVADAGNAQFELLVITQVIVSLLTSELLLYVLLLVPVTAPFLFH